MICDGIFPLVEFQADSGRVASPKDTEVFRLHRSGRGGHLRQEGGQALDEAHSTRQGDVGPEVSNARHYC